MRSWMKPALYQDLLPHMLILLQKCISNHETISNAPSFRVIRALIASQSTFEIYSLFLTFLYCCFLYLILHTLCSVLTCNILTILGLL